MLIFKTKWLGLVIMGVAVLVAIASGTLAFGNVIATDDAITIIQWSVVLGFVPGFVLHMSAVRRQWKEKQHQEDNKSEKLP